MLSTTATHEPSGLAGRMPAARSDPSSYRTAAGWVIAGLWLVAIVYVVALYHVGDRERTFRRMLALATATDRHAVVGYRTRRDGVLARRDGVIRRCAMRPVRCLASARYRGRWIRLARNTSSHEQAGRVWLPSRARELCDSELLVSGAEARGQLANQSLSRREELLDVKLRVDHRLDSASLDEAHRNGCESVRRYVGEPLRLRP
jgi:hypothetical protein